MRVATTEQAGPRIATFKLPANEYARLERIAQDDDRTISAVLRLAVRFYLLHHDEAQA